MELDTVEIIHFLRPGDENDSKKASAKSVIWIYSQIADRTQSFVIFIR